MIWPGIIIGIMVDPWGIADGRKITTDVYIDFLKQHVISWLKMQRFSFRGTIVYMQDNAPSLSAHKTRDKLQKFGFCGPWKVNWRGNAQDIKPIENFWNILKRREWRPI